jgi:hypothetical protein
VGFEDPRAAVVCRAAIIQDRLRVASADYRLRDTDDQA